MMSIFLALAAAAASPASDGLSNGATEQVVLRVDHGDLDLRTPAGREALKRRLYDAGSRACDEGSGPKAQFLWQRIATCRATARAEADRVIEQTTQSMLAANERDLPDL